MLATIARFLFGHTLVAPLTTCWRGGTLLIVREWPVRAVSAVVPCVTNHMNEHIFLTTGEVSNMIGTTELVL